jgi:hypothetical protein
VAPVVSLSPGESALGRDFTDPARSIEDLAALGRIRAALVRRLRSDRGGGNWTVAGESHWLVIPGLRALTRSRPVFGVGFFGQAREHVDHSQILAFERNLLARAHDFTGLLAYYNVRFDSGQWGNLVLFETEDAPGRVRSDPIHAQALECTAEHYSSVRLHRLRFTDGAIGETRPVLDSTLLIDFSETPPWRAVRRGAG